MATPCQQIKYWKNKFRTLKDWNIKFDPKSKLKGQVCGNHRDKKAIIYDLDGWNGKSGMPKDYIFHEIVHICFKDIMKARGNHKIKRNKEERFVQDLCKIINFRNRKYEVILNPNKEKLTKHVN